MDVYQLYGSVFLKDVSSVYPLVADMMTAFT